MLGRSAGILATSALGASAFLIPAGIADVSDKPFVEESLVVAGDTVLRLPCADCKAGTDDSEVILNFTVTDDKEELQLNGVTIFPVSLERAAFSGPRISVSMDDDTSLDITASRMSVALGPLVGVRGPEQVPVEYHITELDERPVSLDKVFITLYQDRDGKLDISRVDHFPPRRISGGLFDDSEYKEGESHPETGGFLFPPPPPPNQKDDFVKIAPYPPPGTPIGFRNRFLHGSPPHDAEEPSHDGDEALDFTILPHPFGRPEGHGPPHHGPPHMGPDCHGLPAFVCRIKHLVEGKVKGMRKGGCRGRKGSTAAFRPGHDGDFPFHGPPPFFHHGMDGDEQGPPREHFQHGPPHHGHHHHGHHRGLRFMRAFGHGFAAALIPTLAGVAVGITVSVIGLLVGRMISFLWIQLVRGGRRGQASVALRDNHAEQGEAIKGLLHDEDEEPLPLYEDAPAYMEKEVETERE